MQIPSLSLLWGPPLFMEVSKVTKSQQDLSHHLICLGILVKMQLPLHQGLTSSNVYGGKNNDTVTIGGIIAGSTINGDIGSDTINITGATLESGSVVQGGQNEDTITLTGVTTFSNDSTVFGGQGNDTINSANSIGNVIISGDNDNDTVTSGLGADILNGGNGADNLTGGAGTDTITGGLGVDTLVGDAEATSLYTHLA